ncbi:MAG: hypothetical protein ACQES1_08490 [Bacteroidota bacterium]
MGKSHTFYKKKKIFLFCFIAFIAVLFLIAHISFFNKVKYYKSAKIQFTGISDENFKKIEAYGITPYNRKIILHRSKQTKVFYSDNNLHLKDIIIESRGISSKSFKNMKIIHCDKVRNIQSDKMLLNKDVHVLNYFEPEINIFSLYISSFKSSGFIKGISVIFLFVIIIMTFVLFIFLRFKKFIIFLKWMINSKNDKKHIDKKHLFFAILKSEKFWGIIIILGVLIQIMLILYY